MADIPDVQAVRDWATVSAQSLTDAQIQQILDTETALQAAACLVPEAPEDYPAALAQAVLRRCARQIGARQTPLGLTADTSGEYAPVRLPYLDSEIERLEAPFRVIAVA